MRKLINPKLSAAENRHQRIASSTAMKLQRLKLHQAALDAKLAKAQETEESHNQSNNDVNSNLKNLTLAENTSESSSHRPLEFPPSSKNAGNNK